MSGYAYQWAKRQRVGDSSAKTLLKTYANWAGEDYATWMTNDEIELDTELNIQTIRRARQKLIDLGYLVQTGKRIGRTRSIVVYQMLAPPGAAVVQIVDQRSGKVVDLVPPTAKEYEYKCNVKRGGSKYQEAEMACLSKDRAAPDFNESELKFHVEGSEITLEEEPHLAGNKALEGIEKNGDQRQARRTPRIALHGRILNMTLPTWLAFEIWDAWCQHREAKEKTAALPWTIIAAAISLRKLKQLRDMGQTPDVSIDEAVLRGWTGLFPVPASSLPASASMATGCQPGRDWYLSVEGIKRQGEARKIKAQAEGEPWLRYRARVVKASGSGAAMEKMLAEFANTKSVYDELFAYFNDAGSEATATEKR